MGRAIFRLGPDAYVEWSSVVDAPVTYICTRQEMLDAGVDPSRLARADRHGHSLTNTHRVLDPAQLIAGNRAGPREACLTLEALLRRYDPSTPDDVELRPEEIQPCLTVVVAPGHPDDGKRFWIPWRPGEAPDRITAEKDLQAMVPADDDAARTPPGLPDADLGPSIF